MMIRRWLHFSLSGFVLALTLILFPPASLPLIAALAEEISAPETPQADSPQDNTTPHPLFGDVNVRRAFAHCTDRRALFQSAFPFATADEFDDFGMDSFFPNNHWAYAAASSQHTLKFDPEAGSQLFEAAGYVLSPGESIRSNAEGYDLTAKLTVLDSPLRRTWVPALAQQWKENCGIRLVTEYVPGDVLFAQGGDGSLSRREFAGVAFSSNVSLRPLLSQFYSCDSVPTEEELYGGPNFNIMGWCNPTVDEALSLEGVAQLQQELLDLYNVTQEEFRKDAPSLPLFLQMQVYGATSRIGGYAPRHGIDTVNAYSQEYAISAQKRLRMKGTQPTDLYLDPSLAHQRIEPLIHDQAVILNDSYEFEAHALEQVPTFENGQMQQIARTVTAGDKVFNSEHEIVTLAAGEQIRLADNTIATFDGGTANMYSVQAEYRYKRPLRWSDGEEVSAGDFQLGYGAYCDALVAAGRSDDFSCARFLLAEFADDGLILITIPGGTITDLPIPPFPPRPSHQIIQSGGEHQGKRLGEVPFEDWTKLPEVTDTPLTTGPYRIVSWERGDKMELEANPFFRLGPPGFEEVTIYFNMTNAQAHQALVDGELDIANGIAGTNVPTITVYHVPTLSWDHIDFNFNLYDEAVSRMLPASGGTISNSLGISLTVPDGAVASDFTVILNFLPRPRHSLLGIGTPIQAFDVTLLDSSEQILSSTLESVEVEVRFNDELLHVIDPQTLEMRHWDGTKWVEVALCAECGLHPPNRFVFQTDTFSEFALVGRGQLLAPALYR